MAIGTFNEIKEHYLEIKAAIEATVDASRRPVTVIAVTKTRTTDEIRAAVDAGAADLGENRVQEYLSKRDAFEGEVRWHLIGPLQTNKVKYLKGGNVFLQSLDRIALAEEIERRLGGIDALVQVNISGEPQKSGVSPERLESFLEELSRYPGISLKGLMCIAEDADERAVGRQFETMRRLFEGTFRAGLPNYEPKYLSMGMTNDYMLAIKEGSNMVRIGTGLFGRR